MNSRLLIAAISLVILLAGCSRESPKQLTRVKVVRLPYLSAAPLLIAEHEGYFRKHGLEIEFVTFRRSGEAMAALARGQIDVVSGAVNLVLLNAIESGAHIRAVADKGHITASSCAVSALMVHRDALRDGTLQSVASLKGKKVDFRENSILSYGYEMLLRKYGLTLEDVDSVILPRGAQLAALQNRAVAAISTPDPWMTMFQDSGSIVPWHSLNEGAERLQYSIITYGPSFLEGSNDGGQRFMLAYIEGVRQYNQGRTERNLAALAQATGVDASVLSRCCWPDVNPDGAIMPDGLEEYQEWAVRRGELSRVLRMDELWEPRFVQHATRVLGKAKPSGRAND